MSARVLVVDDIIQNVKLLEAKLQNEYFDVITALSGKEALKILETDLPDIILLDVMMPEMDGFEVCRRIKSNPRTTHIPVIMVTALDQTSKRVEGLEAGADDFLSKPIKDLPLFARLRSLVRLKMLMDELRMREVTVENLKTIEVVKFPLKFDLTAQNTNILLIESSSGCAQRLSSYMDSFAKIDISDGNITDFNLCEYDLIMISLSLPDIDGLRLCSQIKNGEETRHTPLIVLVDEEENDKMVQAMEIGVMDYLVRPVDKNELIARVKSQIRQKMYAESLRENMKRNMEMAITDSVTGLYNRYFLNNYLKNLLCPTNEDRNSVSIIMMDIDFFKKVNDTYGHMAGDEVLVEFAQRIVRNIRTIDLAVRYGGEEFIIILPKSDAAFVKLVAERIRARIEKIPFKISDHSVPINITVSIGVSLSADKYMDGTSLMGSADEALYQAKETGRNKVCGL